MISLMVKYKDSSVNGILTLGGSKEAALMSDLEGSLNTDRFCMMSAISLEEDCFSLFFSLTLYPQLAMGLVPQQSG